MIIFIDEGCKEQILNDYIKVNSVALLAVVSVAVIVLNLIKLGATDTYLYFTTSFTQMLPKKMKNLNML